MEVVYAYLANYVEFTQDGGLTMIHGDLESFVSAAFPTTPYNFSLAIKALLSAEEAGRDHALRIEVVRTEKNQGDGEIIQPVLEATMPVPSVASDSRFARANIVAQFVGVTFPREGQYSVRILVDGEERKRIPLQLTRQSPAKS
jgi:hypothetical protein